MRLTSLRCADPERRIFRDGSLRMAAAMLLAVTTSAVAERISLDAYGTDQGLSQTTVNALAEDARGFLWVATQEGLNRFDGSHFETYLRASADAEGLLSSSVDSLAIGADGDLWIGSNDAGLQLWHLPTGRRSGADAFAGASHRTVSAIVLDGDAGAWLMTPVGVDYVDRSRGSQRALLSLSSPVGLQPAGEGEALALDADCGLWRLGRDRVRREPTPLPAGLRCSSLLVGDGALWVGDSAAAVWWRAVDGERWQRIDTGAGVSADIRSLLQTADGRTLAGRADGAVFELDQAGTTQRLRFDQPLRSAVLTLFESRAGVLWIGTETRGLFRVRPLSAAIRRDAIDEAAQESWPSRSVRALWQGDGRWLVGTDGGLVQRVDDGRWTRPPAIPAVSVRAIEADPSGGWWIGTHAGLWKLAADGSAREIPGLPNPRVTDLLRSPEGLWVATRGGLALLRGDRFEPERVPVDLRELFVTCLMRDARQRLWIGSNEHGLFRLETDGGLRHYQARDGGLAHDSVWSLLETADAVWAGSFSGGLQRIDRRGGSLRVFTQRDGLSNDVIYRIEPDPRGRLWLSTNRGLSVLDPGDDSVQTLQPDDGLRNHEFNSGASLRGGDGLLYFGGIDGLDAIAPDALDVVSRPAEPAIATMRMIASRDASGRGPARRDPIAAATVAYDEQVRLDYRDLVVALDLAAIDFSAPQSARLRYRLQGLADDWVYPSRPHAELLLSHLAAGSYRLQVEAAGRDGRFTRSRQLLIEVEPPPWRHPLAWLGYGLIALSLLAWQLAKARARMRDKQAQIELLNRTVGERTAELELANARLRESNVQLESATRTDPLTRTANRRELQDWLQREGGRVAAGQRRHLFCMVDIDDFKQINDSLGHATGDEVLVAIADRLRGIVRGQDLLVRWGGEEFMLLFADAGAADMARLGTRVRDEIGAEPLHLGNGRALRVTASVGLAPWPFLAAKPMLGDWQRSIDLADRALYIAKRSGKNAWIAIAPAIEPEPSAMRRLLGEPLGEVLPASAVTVQSAADASARPPFA